MRILISYFVFTVVGSTFLPRFFVSFRHMKNEIRLRACNSNKSYLPYRFRGYFKALMSSVRLVCCQPGRFFLKRASSKSSLDIGVRPMNGGVVGMELRHYTNRMINQRPNNLNSGSGTKDITFILLINFSY